MKTIKFIVTGILFGIIMTKSEAVSWYRIQEMFRFQSIFMYGIIGTAVITGIMLVAAIKKYQAERQSADIRSHLTLKINVGKNTFLADQFLAWAGR